MNAHLGGCLEIWKKHGSHSSEVPSTLTDAVDLIVLFSIFPQALQKWNLGDREFLATPNTRNEMMLKEASEFAAHLKRCEKDIRTLKNATEGENFGSFLLETTTCQFDLTAQGSYPFLFYRPFLNFQGSAGLSFTPCL